MLKNIYITKNIYYIFENKKEFKVFHKLNII